METIPMLLKEMEHEASTTRKMLERVPQDKYDWQPHEKSMTVTKLATHLAELPGWVKLTFETNELDFAKGDYKPVTINDNAELMDYFEKSYADGKSSLSSATEEDLALPWTLRNADTILQTYTKAEVVRMAFCQIVHHRAQLGVYLRLLNIPFRAAMGQARMK